MNIIETLAKEFSLKVSQVEATVGLIDDGNTIPFIARYRKEVTGSLDDTVLRNLDERLKYLRNLEERKEEVRSLIEAQGKLTDEIVEALNKAQIVVWEVKTESNYSLTVSGVNKKYAIPYLYEKYGDNIMDEFKDGLIIPPSYTGKNIHTYIDFETSGTVIDYYGNACDYLEKSSIHLEESGYELSLSREFIDYLLGIKLKEN